MRTITLLKPNGRGWGETGNRDIEEISVNQDTTTKDKLSLATERTVLNKAVSTQNGRSIEQIHTIGVFDVFLSMILCILSTVISNDNIFLCLGSSGQEKNVLQEQKIEIQGQPLRAYGQFVCFKWSYGIADRRKSSGQINTQRRRWGIPKPGLELAPTAEVF